MPKSKRFYELSTEADQDIDAIFDYTEIEFGFDQAVKYVSEFDDFFVRLLDNPELGKKRDEIKAGLFFTPVDFDVSKTYPTIVLSGRFRSQGRNALSTAARESPTIPNK